MIEPPPKKSKWKRSKISPITRKGRKSHSTRISIILDPFENLDLFKFLTWIKFWTFYKNATMPKMINDNGCFKNLGDNFWPLKIITFKKVGPLFKFWTFLEKLDLLCNGTKYIKSTRKCRKSESTDSFKNLGPFKKIVHLKWTFFCILDLFKRCHFLKVQNFSIYPWMSKNKKQQACLKVLDLFLKVGLFWKIWNFFENFGIFF